VNESLNDWMIVWQRRLRYGLDDRLARELSEALRIRIRTFERSADRVLGERALHVRGEIAFLAVENDDYESPIVRLVGPTALSTDLWAMGAEFDVMISRLEVAWRRRSPTLHGTPVWMPFPDAIGSDAVRLVLPAEDLGDSLVLWPEGLATGHRGSAVAGLGVIVDSIAEAASRSVETGGILTDVITLATGEFAELSAPGRIRVLLWQPPEEPLGGEVTAAQARLDVRTQSIADVVTFFQRVIGWRTEVVAGSPLTALLTHEGSRVGIVTEDPSTTEHEVSILSPHPQTLVRSATEAEEYTVQTTPLRFPLGRRWSITDTAGNWLVLAEEPDEEASSPRLRRSWLHLPTVVLVAVADLRTALDLLERTLKEILLDVPAPPSSEQSSALLDVLRSVLDPAASKFIRLLRDSDPSGQILEVLAAQRQTVQGLVDDLRLVAQSLEDEELISAYGHTRRLLVRSGLLVDIPGAVEETDVQL
jgi:predicted enzyme related to lactoylglutathione lyase